MLSEKSWPRPRRRYLILLLLLTLVIYVVVPQLKGFQSSLHLLSHPVAGWTALAIIFTGLTYLSAAGTYYFLAFKKLAYWQMALVQLAVMFVNRLLPAGLGGLGANYYYLRKRGHSQTQAAASVAVNNLLGVVGHALILVVALVLGGWSGLAHRPELGWRQVGYVGMGIAVLAVAYVLAGRQKARRFLRQTAAQLTGYRRRPYKLGLALSTSIGLTMANMLAFYCCALALGIHLTGLAAILIFTLGAGAGNFVPTPGGLGGFEAGLVAGLAAYRVDAPTALAAALLYRLVSYWLPLVVGGIALALSRRQGWL